jgi:haloalkane dehalogenase
MSEERKSRIGYLLVGALVLAVALILFARKDNLMTERTSKESEELATLVAEASKSGEAWAISAEVPYESRFIEILGSKIHYVEGGTGDPILFLHGNPTSSYLWRNIMPHLEAQGRVIAMDLIGMGGSEKPDLGYRFFDHYPYVEGFIEAMGLENITLVTHDWGAALGFHYASLHEDNTKGVVFMEAVIPFLDLLDRAPPEGSIFYKLRHPEIGPQLVLEDNFFVEGILPGAIMRKLSDQEMAHYRAPYPTPESRKPTLVWPNEIPFAGRPEATAKMVRDIGQWIEASEKPLLYLWVRPGIVNPMGTAEKLTAIARNIETQYVGQGIHFIQEDVPHEIGLAISDWYRRIDGD